MANTDFDCLISRRKMLRLSLAALTTPSFARAAPAGRTLDFQIDKGFGNASPADIKAVLNSAAESIWSHCKNTRWDVSGFFIYHSKDFPICINDHRPDGRIAIGLTSQGTLWSQFAYQFSHEFCHALAGHSNDWQKCWIRGRKANHWLEESICETASLFAMRAMGKSWQTTPPYANWKDYAIHLTTYAADRIATSRKNLNIPFIEWFHENEASMRIQGTLREKNNIVALALLPLFEANASGWESMPSYNLGKRDPEKTLSAHFSDWSAVAPPNQRKFIADMAAVFDVMIS